MQEEWLFFNTFNTQIGKQGASAFSLHLVYHMFIDYCSIVLLSSTKKSMAF